MVGKERAKIGAPTPQADRAGRERALSHRFALFRP